MNKLTTAPSPRPEPAAVGRPARNPWLVLAVLCLGLYMIVLDTTVVNIAIPSIITNLGADRLPAGSRQPLASAVSAAARGDASSTPNRLPQGLGAAGREQLLHLVHQVFVGGYLDALKNVAVVPIAMVLVAALTTVLLPRLAKRAPAATQVAEEVAA